MRELSLSGGDLTVIKALGLSGTSMPGALLVDRIGHMEAAELIDTLEGLMMLGFVVSDSERLKDLDDLKRTNFHVNTSYVRDLKEALNPAPKKKERRRRRG